MKKDVYRADIESLGLQCERHAAAPPYALRKAAGIAAGCACYGPQDTDGQFGCASAGHSSKAQTSSRNAPGRDAALFDDGRPDHRTSELRELGRVLPATSFLNGTIRGRLRASGPFGGIAGVTARNAFGQSRIYLDGVVHNSAQTRRPRTGCPHARKRDRSG